MKFPQTLLAGRRSFRPDPSSPKASVHLRNSHTVSGLQTSPWRRPGLRSIANSRKILTYAIIRDTVGYRSDAVHRHIALCGRAWISLFVNPSARCRNKQVATSGCFAAHPDVAARTAGTNASGNHVTPSNGAARAALSIKRRCDVLLPSLARHVNARFCCENHFTKLFSRQAYTTSRFCRPAFI